MSNNPENEIERISGFANANGDGFASANAAYNAYLNATGEKPDRKNKGKFKAWLKTAKDSGQLQKMIQKGGGAIKSQVDKSHTDIKSVSKTPDINDVPESKEKKKIPMSSGKILAITLVSAAVVVTASILIYKHIQKKKAGAGSATV